MPRLATSLVLQHDPRLVALSATICLLGCCTTAMLLRRMDAASRAASRRWLAAAAAIFGCSVWSLHFVALLAYLPGLAKSYDVVPTVLSMLVASTGAAAALTVRRARLAGPVRSVASGTLLGLSIACMHYLGAAAMRFGAMPAYNKTWMAASVVAGIVFSTIGIARSEPIRTARRCLEVAGWLSLAICASHFIGMASMTPMAAGTMRAPPGGALGSSSLAMAVGGVSVVILLACVVAITIEQHLSQRALQELDRMRLMSNLAHEVLLIQRNGVVLEVNRAGERLFKASARDMIGQPLLGLFAEHCAPTLLRRLQCTPPHGHPPEEIEFQAVDGTQISVEFSCQPIQYLGKPAVVMALLDLTDRRRGEAHLQHMARHDALTGLPNRHTLQERLALALDAVARSRGTLALVYLDLDRFKAVNDLFGHAVGDALLVQASRRISGELQSPDSVSRIGGDEFVLVLTEPPQPETTLAVVTRIIESLRRPFDIEGLRIEISASAGIALYPGDGTSIDTLMRAADAALYRVKDEGRNALRFFEASMNAALQDRLQLEQQLVGAVERNELVLHYQPIVNCNTGAIETLEALVRWQHPRRGLIQPGDFIPLAETAGLIGRIGRWVIDTACREAAGWAQPWRVSINVSPKQFHHSDLCAEFESAIRRYALDPARVELEVTEGVLIEDASRAVASFRRFREAGIRIALDDFGTGYSSLNYLQLFRFDAFKIDQSFVQRLGESEDALVIARTIVNLGHNLGLQVTAEGVETRAQLDILRMLGCDQVQGYLIARPFPVAHLDEPLRMRAASLFRAAPGPRLARSSDAPDAGASSGSAGDETGNGPAAAGPERNRQQSAARGDDTAGF